MENKFFKNTKNSDMIFVIVDEKGKTRKERFVNGFLKVSDADVEKTLKKTLDFQMGYIVSCDADGKSEADKKELKAQEEKMNKAINEATAEKDAELAKKDAELEELKKQLNLGKEKKDESKK